MTDKPQEKREYERTPLTPISIKEYNEFRRWKTRRREEPPTYIPPPQLSPPTLDDSPSLGNWVGWGLGVGVILWFLWFLFFRKP